jgi:hypothetical protein
VAPQKAKRRKSISSLVKSKNMPIQFSKFKALLSSVKPRQFLVWALGEIFIVIIGILLALQIDK